MATMQVEVVSAEQELYSGEVDEVYARSLEGEIGILPGHEPALLALDIAPVVVREEGGVEHYFAVHSGFLFFRDNNLVILADMAEHADDIDSDRAHRAVEHFSQATAEHDEEAAEKQRRDRARIQTLERRGTHGR